MSCHVIGDLRQQRPQEVFLVGEVQVEGRAADARLARHALDARGLVGQPLLDAEGEELPRRVLLDRAAIERRYLVDLADGGIFTAPAAGRLLCFFNDVQVKLFYTNNKGWVVLDVEEVRRQHLDGGLRRQLAPARVARE